MRYCISARLATLQGEVLTIIEAAAREAAPFDAVGPLAEIRALGLKTPSDSIAIIRADRRRNDSR